MPSVLYISQMSVRVYQVKKSTTNNRLFTLQLYSPSCEIIRAKLAASTNWRSRQDSTLQRNDGGETCSATRALRRRD